VNIEQQIVDLELLVQTDAEIKELADKLGQERGEIEEVRTEVGELHGRIAGDGERVSEMEKTRNDLMQEMRQIASQIDRSRDRLGRARNEREVNAAERELDELRKIQRDRDEEVKKLQELSGHARESMVQSEARKTELSATLDGSLEGTMSTIGDLDGLLTAKREEREAVEKELPSMVARRYERLHGRGKVPIATTHDGTCLGCFVKLPPMMFHTMLSRTKFDECPQCHRIIYYTPPPTKEELAAAEAAKAAELEAAEEADEQVPGEASS
jgi:hypothetical protein